MVDIEAFLFLGAQTALMVSNLRPSTASVGRIGGIGDCSGGESSSSDSDSESESSLSELALSWVSSIVTGLIGRGATGFVLAGCG